MLYDVKDKYIVVFDMLGSAISCYHTSLSTPYFSFLALNAKTMSKCKKLLIRKKKLCWQLVDVIFLELF